MDINSDTIIQLPLSNYPIEARTQSSPARTCCRIAAVTTLALATFSVSDFVITGNPKFLGAFAVLSIAGLTCVIQQLPHRLP